MKTIFLTICFAVALSSNAQFTLRTVENDNGTKTIAYCNSSYQSLGSSESTFILGKAVGGTAYMEVLYPNTAPWFSDSNFEEKDIAFVFYTTSKTTHEYNTTTGGYRKDNSGKYWLGINNDKVVEYFKKYTTVVVTIDTYSFQFSLSGFTSCYNAIFK